MFYKSYKEVPFHTLVTFAVINVQKGEPWQGRLSSQGPLSL